MEIALVFPKSTFLVDPMTWPPLGLWYLAAQLEAHGHKTDFFDLSVDELPDDGQFDQLWVSATAPQMAEVKRIAEITKDWTKTKTVLGGAVAWANPKSCIDIPFDIIVAGEADRPDVVQAIVKRTALSSITNKILCSSTSKTLDWVLPPVRRWSLR